MGRGDKFAGLIMYFSELKDNEVSLTFEQIESIVGERLCYSAYNHKEYWYADNTHTFPNCWIDNGYKMNYLNLNEKRVTFTKVDTMSSTPKSVLITDTSNGFSFIRKQPTIPIEKVLTGIDKYYSELEIDQNARYLSWEHCYKQFVKAHKKSNLTEEEVDYLSLHLSFYLASWGMLRGSSFLLQKDYRVHIDIIKELYKPTYNSLWSIDYKGLQNQENLNILLELIDNLKTIYRDKRRNIKVVSTDISDILVTKVLLGTMGCVPAYDEYFKKGVNKYNITTQLLGKSSIKGLADYYEANKYDLETVRKAISQARQIEYPQMKMLDMAFWQLGFDSI
jgi:hypothetical protein